MNFEKFRDKTIALLSQGNMTAKELVEKTGASRASVYRWLPLLEGSGVKKDDLVYFLDKAPLSTPVEVVEESPQSQENPINASAIASFAYKRMGDVRVTTVDGEPWFCLGDVCDVLLIANHRMVASRLDPDEKGVCQTDTLGGKQRLTFVNESGLYAVILRSDKPEAKPFRKWITSEVLPAIRKTGRYEPEPQKPLSQLEMLAAMAQEAVKNEKRLDAVEAEVNALKERRLMAEKQLNLLPSASVTAVPKSTRAMINERVAVYSAATLLSHAEIHKKLHKEFFYRHHINLHSRFMANRDKYNSKLDIVEELGLLEEYLAIACEVLEVA